MKITRVQRLVWDQLEPNTRKKFFDYIAWIPEAVVLFEIDKLPNSVGHAWCDRIEDLSGGRTFPFWLRRTSPILEDINREPPVFGQWLGCIAFERDETASDSY
jgi:hypothetical protein